MHRKSHSKLMGHCKPRIALFFLILLEFIQKYNQNLAHSLT